MCSPIAKLGTTYSGAYLLKRGLLLPDDLPKVMRSDEAEEALRRLGLVDRIAAIINPDPMTPFGRVAALEASMYMRNQLLRDTDWTSMAHSLEVRTPLVDAYLLRQLAPILLAYGAQCKAEFARAPQDPLPRNIAERPKTGFQAPLREWMRLAPDSTSTRMRSWAQVVLENYG